MNNESSLKSKTISSIFWKLLEKGGTSLVQMVVQIVLARLLAPEQFGALAIILVFINLGNVIVQSGLNTALVQNSNVEADDYSTVFWLSFGLSLILYLAVFFSAPYVASFYVMDYLAWPLRVIAVVFIINSFNSVQIAILQREMNFKVVFQVTLMSVLISGIVGVLLAFLGTGLWALIVQNLILQLCSCLLLSVKVKWFPRFVFSAKRAAEFFSFGWKLLVSGLIDQGYQSLSDLIIGKQFSASMLGLVSQGKKYPQAVGVLLDGAIQPVMLSTVSHIQSNKVYVKRVVRRALKTSTFLIMPCMILLAVVAEPAVRILLGEQWLPCVPFLQMYCFVYALLPIQTSNLQALNGLGRSDLFLKLEIIKKGYGIIFILIAAFFLQDVYALVASYMLASVLSTIVNSWPNRSVLEYSYLEQLRDICPALFLTGFSALAASLLGMLSLPDPILIIFQALVMLLLYFGLARIVKLEAFTYLISTIKEMHRRN